MGPLGELWRLGSQEGMWQSPKRQMSDSLGAAPLAQFAPASLTSAPPGADTGMEAEEAVGTRTKKKRTKSGNDLGVSRTWNLTHVWQHTIFDAANAMGIPYLRYSVMHE